MWDEKRKMHFCVIFPLKRHKYHSIKKKKCIHFLHNNDITLSTSPLKLSALRKFNCIIHKKSRIQVYFLLLWNMFYKIAAFYEKNLEFSRLFIFLILRQNEQANTLINNPTTDLCYDLWPIELLLRFDRIVTQWCQLTMMPRVLVLQMDYHRCLPTLKVSSQDSFYLRKFRTYLFGVYSANEDILNCFFFLQWIHWQKGS